MFKSLRNSFREMSLSIEKMFDEMEKPFQAFEEDLKAVPVGTEQTTVVEETKPDGTRTVTKTTIRHFSTTTTTVKR